MNSIRLDKHSKEVIVRAAVQAIKPPDDDLDVQHSISVFHQWHNNWMGATLRKAFHETPEIRQHLKVHERAVNFGALVSWRKRNEQPECVKELQYLIAFDDIYEPIIDFLEAGKTVRTKQWSASKCPDAVCEWLQRYYAFKRAKVVAEDEVQRAVMSCSTNVALIKKFPQLAPYVTNPTSNLPAIPVQLAVFARMTATNAAALQE